MSQVVHCQESEIRTVYCTCTRILQVYTLTERESIPIMVSMETCVANFDPIPLSAIF